MQPLSFNIDIHQHYIFSFLDKKQEWRYISLKIQNLTNIYIYFENKSSEKNIMFVITLLINHLETQYFRYLLLEKE